MSGSFDRDPDIEAAADFAAKIRHRDALKAFAGCELSGATINELIAKGVATPAALTDGSWTEANMQRALTASAFQEVKEYRRRN